MKQNIKSIGIAIAAFSLTLPCAAQERWDLEKCISYAVSHNLTVKQQEAARDKSAIDLNTAKWSRLPDLNGNASHSFNFGRSLQANNTYQSINTQSTGFSVSTSIPLFTGLQIPNTIALSKLNLMAAVEDLNKAKEDISIQVASAYLQVLFNQELAKVAEDQVSLSKDMLVQKEAFFKNGKASESEWMEAKARVAQDQLSAVQAGNNLSMALLDLSQLLELPSPDNFDIEAPEVKMDQLEKELTSPADIYNQAVLTKPAVMAAMYRLQGAAKSIKIAQSAWYPQLSLGAGLSTNYYKVSGRENAQFRTQLRDNFSQYVGVSLSIPIFNRLSTRNRVRSARLDQTTLSWQLEETKKSLYKEIQQAYYNAVNSKTQYYSSETANEAAESSFQLMKEKYVNGKANATEYNEARTNWMKALSDCIQAKYEYLFRTKILDFYKGIPLTLE